MTFLSVWVLFLHLFVFSSCLRGRFVILSVQLQGYINEKAESHNEMTFRSVVLCLVSFFLL